MCKSVVSVSYRAPVLHSRVYMLHPTWWTWSSHISHLFCLKHIVKIINITEGYNWWKYYIFIWMIWLTIFDSILKPLNVPCLVGWDPVWSKSSPWSSHFPQPRLTPLQKHVTQRDVPPLNPSTLDYSKLYHKTSRGGCLCRMACPPAHSDFLMCWFMKWV